MMLEQKLLWDEQGHLTEPAIAALVDGELSLLPPAAISHAETCAPCADRVGHAALLALDLSEALTQLTLSAATHAVVSPSARSARQPLPLGLLSAALSVALLGSLPNLDRLFHLPSLLVHALPSLVRASLLVLRSPSCSHALAVAGAASAALLLVMGIAIARLDLRLLGQALEKGAR